MTRQRVFFRSHTVPPCVLDHEFSEAASVATCLGHVNKLSHARSAWCRWRDGRSEVVAPACGFHTEAFAQRAIACMGRHERICIQCVVAGAASGVKKNEFLSAAHAPLQSLLRLSPAPCCCSPVTFRFFWGPSSLSLQVLFSAYLAAAFRAPTCRTRRSRITPVSSISLK